MRDLAFIGFLLALWGMGFRRPFLFVCAYIYIDIISPQRLTYYLLNAVPISLIATLGVMYLLGMSIDNISLMGLTLAVGLVIDRHAWSRVAEWMAMVCFLTTLVFPVLYLPLIDAHPLAAAVLLARNVLVVGLFGWSIVALWRPETSLVALRERLALTGSIPVVARG